MGPENNQVQDHLSLCPDCLDAVLLVTSTDTETISEKSLHPIPAGLVKKAKSLVGPAKNKMLFDLVIHFAQEGLEVVHSLITPLPPLYQPAGAALRGEHEEQLPAPLRVEKAIAGVVVEMEISAQGEDAWNVQVLLKKSEQKEPQEGLRVTLKDMGKQREFQSLVARKGIASFQDISNGEYAVEIKDKGIPLGELSFCLS